MSGLTSWTNRHNAQKRGEDECKDDFHIRDTGSSLRIIGWNEDDKENPRPGTTRDYSIIADIPLTSSITLTME